MRNRYVVALLAVLVSAAACGSEPSGGSGVTAPGTDIAKPIQSAQVQVTEAGPAGDSTLYALVQNNEDREVAAQLEFTGYDAAGTAFKEQDTSKSDRYEVIPPKSTIGIASIVALGSGTKSPTIVKAEAKIVNTKSSAIPAHGPGKFTAGPLDFKDHSRSQYVDSIATDITNEYPEAVDSAAVSMLCKDNTGKDNTGKIAIGDTTYFSAAAGAKTKVVFNNPALTVKYETRSTCVLYPRMSNDTRFTK
jgi:uncharacterized protein YcfL